MKVWSDEGRLTVQAETVEEMAALMAITGTAKVVKEKKKELIDVDVKGGRKHRPHKRHQYKKECDICGQFFKGLKGLGIHRKKAHGILSARELSKADLLREQGATPAVPVEAPAATPIEQLVREVNGTEVTG